MLMVLTGCDLQASEKPSTSVAAAQATTMTRTAVVSSTQTAESEIKAEATSKARATYTAAAATISAASTHAAVPCDAIIVPTPASAVLTRVAAGTPQVLSAPPYWEMHYRVHHDNLPHAGPRYQASFAA